VIPVGKQNPAPGGPIPGIFGLQDPRVAHADDLRGIQQIMNSDPNQ
jgi:hypothetical protein